MTHLRKSLMQTRMTTTERELIEASAAIGGISESASWATAGFAAHIDGLGKTVGELTVAELLEIKRFRDELHRKVFDTQPAI